MQQRTTHWRDQLLMQMFGRPQGLLGRIGGVILAQEKRDFFPWVIEQLAAQPGDQVLEVGFGPGVAISHLVKQAVAAHIAGVDYSEVYTIHTELVWSLSRGVSFRKIDPQGRDEQ